MNNINKILKWRKKYNISITVQTDKFCIITIISKNSNIKIRSFGSYSLEKCSKKALLWINRVNNKK